MFYNKTYRNRHLRDNCVLMVQEFIIHYEHMSNNLHKDID